MVCVCGVQRCVREHRRGQTGHRERDCVGMKKRRRRKAERFGEICMYCSCKLFLTLGLLDASIRTARADVVPCSQNTDAMRPPPTVCICPLHRWASIVLPFTLRRRPLRPPQSDALSFLYYRLAWIQVPLHSLGLCGLDGYELQKTKTVKELWGDKIRETKPA